jgi:hypothetical protein
LRRDGTVSRRVVDDGNHALKLIIADSDTDFIARLDRPIRRAHRKVDHCGILLAQFQCAPNTSAARGIAISVAERHIRAMVAVWQQEALAPATVQTYFSFLRGLTAWLGKPGLIRAFCKTLPQAVAEFWSRTLEARFAVFRVFDGMSRGYFLL